MMLHKVNFLPQSARSKIQHREAQRPFLLYFYTGISKNPCFDRSYESDTTVGVVRPQPLLPAGRQKRRVSGVFRDAHYLMIGLIFNCPL
jgi:hypothetical protein